MNPQDIAGATKEMMMWWIKWSTVAGMVGFYTALGNGCNKAPAEQDSEVYNVLPDPIPEPMDAGPIPKDKWWSMPEVMLKSIQITIAYLAENRSELCRLEKGKFNLETQTDGSVTAKIFVMGVAVSPDMALAKGDRRKKVCKLCLLAPWNPESPNVLPWEWVYADQQYLSPKSMAERTSWLATGPDIFFSYAPDGGEPFNELIYPLPGGEDPHNVVLQGYTRFLEGTSISWEKTSINAAAWMRVKDHIGTELEVTYKMAAEQEKQRR